jgi:hypothetical protein
MIADTMGSTETDSTDDLHKMWVNDDLGIYAVGAGIMEYAGELFPIIEKEIASVGVRTHGNTSAALNKAFQLLRAQHFQWDVAWSELSIPQIGHADVDKTLEEWRKFHLNVQLIVGTFDNVGQAYLYIVGQFEGTTKVVHLSEFPGYAAIGTGADNAHFWLNYRQQMLGLGLKRSAYHAYEAKRMAAKSPTVNDAIEIVVVSSSGKSFHLQEDNPKIEGCLVSLPELESMFKKYGPQETNELGHIKPSVSGTRKGGK